MPFFFFFLKRIENKSTKKQNNSENSAVCWKKGNNIKCKLRELDNYTPNMYKDNAAALLTFWNLQFVAA